MTRSLELLRLTTTTCPPSVSNSPNLHATLSPLPKPQICHREFLFVAKIGCRHPDTVVETSSLASVEPVDIHYKLQIPEHIIDCGYLSALQFETIIYASQKHETYLPSGQRAGFLIGLPLIIHKK